VNRRFQAPGEVVRRRGWLLAGAFVLLGVALTLKHIGVPPWAFLVEIGLAIVLVLAFAAKAYRVRRHGIVRADAAGLSLDGVSIAARRRIRGAYLVSFEQPVVRIVRWWTFDVRLEDDDAAQALLTALGFGIGQSIATFRAYVGGRRGLRWMLLSQVVTFGALGALAGALSHESAVSPLGLLVLLGGTIAFTLVPRRLLARVDIGSDGVLVRRLGEQRFVPYSALAETTVDGPDAVLQLRSGEQVRLTMGRSAVQLEWRDALVRRIEEAREAFARGHAVESVAALVAPGGRPVERWLHELRHLTDVRDYREATLERDRLWDLLDDPSTPAATRAGAAVALAAGDDPDARARLRIAADACAEPQLRITLACVAEGAEEPELEAMLESLVRTEE